MGDATLRRAILERLGTFPERVPPDLEWGPQEDRGDHVRVLVTYAVEPGERIPAWLLLPKGPIPDDGWPGILAIHQHGGEFFVGKSQPAGLTRDPMFHYGLDLCRRGYVVLCPDLLCFEDRRPPEYVRRENPYLQDQNYERFEFTKHILMGSCLQTKYLHDLSCSLDVLASLPQVDGERLGAIGHSLGGQETLWLTWFDERIRAAVSSCGFSQIRAILRDGINHNYAMYVPGMLQICDIDAIVADIAPRPFMFTAGDQDTIFPVDGVREIAERAQRAYDAAGASDRLRALIFSGGHSLPEDVKSEAYGFLDRWLKGG
ncbi:MAG: alpha/beta hydrolase family protein [Anaerolineae bacterium]